jgi:geranylgeranyl diphosphate synthase type I
MTAPPVLSRARQLVEPSLRKAVATLHPRLRTPVEYHFGWVDVDGSPVTATSGKAVRPALAVLGAEAVGGDAEQAVPGATALELIHNFSLIHDDILDGDRTRRHRRTVWDVFGVDDAIVVGDSVHTLAFQVLLEDGGPLAVAAARRLGEGTMAMITGQVQDMTLDRAPAVSFDECLEMERNKTGALLAHSVAIGAVLAGADDDDIEPLERYGAELGVAFQAIDDVLGIWGDPSVTGKPVGSDLREHKKSMPVAIALTCGGSLAAEVRDAFAGDMSDDVVQRISDRLADAGIQTQVEQLARSHLDAACAALDERLYLPSATAELLELARFVVARRH